MIAAATTKATATASTCRQSASVSPGRHKMASTIRMGYSATQENVWGAISAAAMPPATPPADIHI